MAQDTSSASNPLAGLLTGGDSGRTNMDWGNLTGHERAVAWGQINDVFMQILGRSATQADAQKYYNMGISNYALGQLLMGTKEFTHTKVFTQLKNGYHYELAQFVGAGFKLSNKLAVAWAQHNYTTTDIQAWVYRHPKIYIHSNDYKSRVDQMRQVYQDTFGLDPYATGTLGNHQVDVLAKRQPTNKGRKGGAPAPPPPPGSGLNLGPDGKWYKTETQPDDPLLNHIHEAALHFQTPDQYAAFLKATPQYRQLAQSKVAATAPADAGLTLNASGRPIQSGLGGGKAAAADVAQ